MHAHLPAGADEEAWQEAVIRFWLAATQSLHDRDGDNGKDAAAQAWLRLSALPRQRHAVTVLMVLEGLAIEAAAALVERPESEALEDAWSARVALQAATTDAPVILHAPPCDPATMTLILDYADGRMPADAALKFAARLAADEPLRAVARAHQDIALWLQDAFERTDMLRVPGAWVPEPRTAPALPKASQQSLGRWRAPVLGALLGFVAGALGTITWFGQGSQAPSLAVAAPLSQALSDLETGSSLELPAQQTVVIAASIVDNAGRACRVFDVTDGGASTRATACRSGSGWVWTALNNNEHSDADVSVASGAEQPLPATRALGPAEEAALKARGWRSAAQP